MTISLCPAASFFAHCLAASCSEPPQVTITSQQARPGSGPVDVAVHANEVGDCGVQLIAMRALGRLLAQPVPSAKAKRARTGMLTERQERRLARPSGCGEAMRHVRPAAR